MFEWQAPEYILLPKGKTWYAALIILFGVFFALAIIQKNFLFGIIIIIGFMATLFWSNRQPRLITFRVSNSGLEIGDTLIPFHRLEAFDLKSDQDIIIFRKKGAINQEIIILVSRTINPEGLKTFLNSKLPEKEINLSFFDHLAHILKF